MNENNKRIIKKNETLNKRFKFEKYEKPMNLENNTRQIVLKLKHDQQKNDDKIGNEDKVSSLNWIRSVNHRSIPRPEIDQLLVYHIKVLNDDLNDESMYINNDNNDNQGDDTTDDDDDEDLFYDSDGSLPALIRRERIVESDSKD